MYHLATKRTTNTKAELSQRWARDASCICLCHRWRFYAAVGGTGAEHMMDLDQPMSHTEFPCSSSRYCSNTRWIWRTRISFGTKIHGGNQFHKQWYRTWQKYV